jgi:hypothetical protein
VKSFFGRRSTHYLGFALDGEGAETTYMATTELTMEQLLEEAPIAAMAAGDVIEGTVIAAEKHEVWLDLGARGTGLVVGR